jgi:hypothetical protein
VEEDGRAGSKQTGLAVKEREWQQANDQDTRNATIRQALRCFALTAEKETRACEDPLKLAAGP